ncbi:hypothetical protein TRIUR3_31646 [Triticum urartu]|nr:hypothetical protein TRIUR3_31646 [Triticum urartu]
MGPASGAPRSAMGPASGAPRSAMGMGPAAESPGHKAFTMEIGGVSGPAGAPDAKGSSEEAAFPPDTPIASEAPVAKVTSSADESSTATEDTPAAAEGEGPAAEAPGPDSEAADHAGGASVVKSSGLGPVVAFLTAVVCVVGAL